MIPPFNELGYPPPGIYPATLDEIDVRFDQRRTHRMRMPDSETTRR